MKTNILFDIGGTLLLLSETASLRYRNLNENLLALSVQMNDGNRANDAK